MVDVTFTMGAVITDGPTIAIEDTMTDPTGVGFIEAVVPAQDSRAVEVHPGDPGDVVVFFMTSNNYEDLTYRIVDGDPITFDNDLLLVGGEVVHLLGADCSEITFTNGDTADAKVRILIARVADEAP